MLALNEYLYIVDVAVPRINIILSGFTEKSQWTEWPAPIVAVTAVDILAQVVPAIEYLNQVAEAAPVRYIKSLLPRISYDKK